LNPKKISKWNFIYNGRKINSVSIKDVEFLKKVNNGEFKFGNGDALRVNLKVIYKMNEILKVFVESRFEILKVIEPIFINRQTDIKY
jgi:hypothetical protein